MGTDKKARHEHRIIVLMDESGFYLLPGVVKTYAPAGHSPVLHPFQTRAPLSVVGAIPPRGQLFTLVRRTAITGDEILLFLKPWQRGLGQNLLVIWDGSPVHRREDVLRFLGQGAGSHIHIEPLPGEAPDLNPPEGVWTLLKDHELANLICHDLDELDHALDLAFRRLRRRPDLLKTCFAAAQLPI